MKSVERQIALIKPHFPETGAPSRRPDSVHVRLCKLRTVFFASHVYRGLEPFRGRTPSFGQQRESE